MIQNHIRPLRFIIDCGAELSIINKNICNPKWQIQSTNHILKVLDRNVETNIVYRIPLFQEFNEKDYFVNFLEYQFHNRFDGLIGNNILVDLNAVINFQTRSLTTNKATIKMYLNEEEENYTNYVDQNQNVLCTYIFERNLFF